MRVYSGPLDAGSYVKNTRSGKERISSFQMHSNKQNSIDSLGGDIGAGVGFKDIARGYAVC